MAEKNVKSHQSPNSWNITHSLVTIFYSVIGISVGNGKRCPTCIMCTVKDSFGKIKEWSALENMIIQGKTREKMYSKNLLGKSDIFII